MDKLLDTTIFIDFLRGNIQAKNYLQHQPNLQCSLITAAELIQGARDKRAQYQTEQMLRKIHIIPITQMVGEKMLKLIKIYAISNGLQIPDALIAATAIDRNLTLVTANTKHFSFLKEIKVISWLTEKRIEHN